MKVVECRRVHQVCPSEGCESTPSLPTITTWVNFNLTGDRKLEDGDVKKIYGVFFLWRQYHFFAGGHRDYLAGGNLRMSIHRGDTIGECLAPRISPPEIVQEYKIKHKIENLLQKLCKNTRYIIRLNVSSRNCARI